MILKRKIQKFVPKSRQLRVRSAARAEQPAPLEHVDEARDFVLDGRGGAVDYQFRRIRCLIGRGDAGEFRQQARARLAVQAFRVARLAHGERAVTMDFDEIWGRDQGPGTGAVGA
ncbi:conserved hypothetical protein [Ricinus communis]|uniref:Uncharacterized protein n=1 Tax=Ricinus communis TaxID=3988 RepID=B9TQN1_RICCO|nr:conserved hypothetical protein [Ricinus communis]